MIRSSIFPQAFHFIKKVFGFPLFQRLMITALGFNYFTSLRVVVDLHFTRFVCAKCRGRR